MESRLNSSGNIHRILNVGHPRRDSKNYDGNSVNLHSSKTGSSSCQFTTTLYWENKDTQKNVKIIQLQFEDLRACVGHS